MLWWEQPQSLGDEAPASHRPLGTILTLVLRVKEGELRFVGGEVFLFWGVDGHLGRRWAAGGGRGEGGVTRGLGHLRSPVEGRGP